MTNENQAQKSYEVEAIGSNWSWSGKVSAASIHEAVTLVNNSLSWLGAFGSADYENGSLHVASLGGATEWVVDGVRYEVNWFQASPVRRPSMVRLERTLVPETNSDSNIIAEHEGRRLKNDTGAATKTVQTKRMYEVEAVGQKWSWNGVVEAAGVRDAIATVADNLTGLEGDGCPLEYEGGDLYAPPMEFPTEWIIDGNRFEVTRNNFTGDSIDYDIRLVQFMPLDEQTEMAQSVI